jgi:hypothetical protein
VGVADGPGAFAMEDCRHITRRLECDLLAAGAQPIQLMAQVGGRADLTWDKCLRERCAPDLLARTSKRGNLRWWKQVRGKGSLIQFMLGRGEQGSYAPIGGEPETKRPLAEPFSHRVRMMA